MKLKTIVLELKSINALEHFNYSITILNANLGYFKVNRVMRALSILDTLENQYKLNN